MINNVCLPYTAKSKKVALVIGHWAYGTMQ